MADVSWTSQSPQVTSPSILVRQPTRASPGPGPPVASHVFGPLTTQVDPDSPDRPETGISPGFPPDSRSLPRLDPGSLPWQDHRSLHRSHTETTGPLHWSQTEDPGPLQYYSTQICIAPSCQANLKRYRLHAYLFQRTQETIVFNSWLYRLNEIDMAYKCLVD